ncbi:MAG TPA: transcription antitermination factor NusB [Victivallales bacterium]|nr:transcription antitermination factor NusB [Victivallales bacterium]
MEGKKESVSKREKCRPIDHRRLGREFAMQFLFQLDYDEANSIDALPYFWEQLEKSEVYQINRNFEKAKAFAEKLIKIVVSEKDRIDSEIAKFAKNWRLDRMGCVDRNVMRVAVAEMLFLDDIPPIVSINEAVETAKFFGSESSGSFVNGILNSVKDSLDRPAREALKKK